VATAGGEQHYAGHALAQQRETANQQHADALSKAMLHDLSDWRLRDAIYQQLLSNPALGGRRPSLDVFASNANTKVPGSYFSLFTSLGALGVDAFTHRWDVPVAGTRHLAFINGPFHLQVRLSQPAYR
jgi:hypothetical protein